MNKKFLILFIIGIIVSEIFFVISGIVKEPSEDLDPDFVTEWLSIDDDSKFVYYVIYAIFIPISVFPILKKKIPQRWLYLYSFIGGVTFHYAISVIIKLLVKWSPN